MEQIKTIHEVNPALAYLQGMLWAAFSVKVISDDAHEWQIDAMKEYASKLKEAEIEHINLPQTEKDNLKHQWKQWIDATTCGFKDKLKEERRLV